MKNFVQPGETITLPAPTGGVTSGDGVAVGWIFGVAAYSAAEGDEVEVATRGVFTLPKASATEFAIGDPVYWDATSDQCDGYDADDNLIGVALFPAGNGAGQVTVRLNGVFGDKAADAAAAT